ncbi:phosphotransferase family protein [Phyllobacterium sp. 628]|uniref:phosphotransferase family protein n=1 Tax=Phyllobacterium sp. 628 TaxID=2718938 RepID=UPI001662509D|nr:phosphotransferase family protein [Phyllobacterium sp. 628]QND52640.1 phosphotransferase family protein [Phyllobacterium sp. 628]
MTGSGAVDHAGKVRAGEELNAEAVSLWLQSLGVPVEGVPEVTQFSGGASNWTYRLQYPQHDLILRRPPSGTKAKSAHDMGREYTVQKSLKPFYPAVPTMVGLCDDESVIGAQFYVMERIAGIIPRRRMPDGVKLAATDTRYLCENMLDKLVELHRIDVPAAGLSSLGKGNGYVQRQVFGWSERCVKAHTWNTPSFSYVRAWLKANIPQDTGTCLIHNDWRFDNLVLDPQDLTNIIGVLDWEMATLGDPLMDLGGMLAYWVESGDGYFMKMTQRQPTAMPGMMKRTEVVDYYLRKSGLNVSNFAFYEVFGLFRLAVIAQQIYYRYYHRQTRNPAFKNIWIMVNYFDWRCRRIIRQSGN